MLGNPWKNQHTVQKAYLKAFCDPVPHEKNKTVLWVHSANELPVRRSPKMCAVEPYFYCYDNNGQRSFLFEKYLSDLEGASGNVVKAARNGNLPTTSRDRDILARYVAMSLVRTSKSKRLIDQATIDHRVQQIRNLINDPVRHAEFCAARERETGKRMDPEESIRALTGGKVRAEQTNRGWSLGMMAEILKIFQRRFMGMRLLLMHANNAFLVTSDCPVAVHDSATIPLLPQGFQSLEMRFPLSREYCLAGTYSPGQARLELDADQVRKLNGFLIRQADRFVYAPFNADYIQAELQKSSAKRIATPQDGVISF